MVNYCRAAITAFVLLTSSAVQAQNIPSYAQPQPMSDEQIRGRIVGFDGAYSLALRDERGFVDNVRLHQGTIINPVGLALEPGMIVCVMGYNVGPYLDAEEIDTPYTFYGAMPYYEGHPWNYYGPTIGLNFYFGNTGWWHRGYYSDEHFYGEYRGGGGRGEAWRGGGGRGEAWRGEGGRGEAWRGGGGRGEAWRGGGGRGEAWRGGGGRGEAWRGGEGRGGGRR
jgi:hypothetical protein